MNKQNTNRFIGAFIRFLCLIAAGIILFVSALPAYAAEPESESTAAPETEAISEAQAGLSEDPRPTEPFVISSATALYADSQQDENYILVEKRFSGLAPELIPDTFRVTVVSESGDTFTLTRENTLAQTSDADGHVIWHWKLTAMGTGSYTVTESGEEAEGYTVTKQGEGTVEVKAADMTVLVPVHETTCSHTNWPVKADDDSNLLFAATLTQGGVAVISRSPLSASQRAAVSEAVLKINGPWKKPVYFYSVEEQLQNGTGFELNGATITYNAANEEVIIGQTRNWQHVATLQYLLSEADNPEITLHNLYEAAVTKVTVRKNVSGNMADKEKRFAFTVSVAIGGTDGRFTMNGEAFSGSATFSLRDGESAVLENIPVGARVTVAEDDYTRERYEPSYTLDQSETFTGGTAVISCAEATGHDVLFVNRKEIPPDTGVSLDSLPYLILFGTVAAGFGWRLLFRKRRNA